MDPVSDYAWWRAALVGEKPAVVANNPQCGYYKRRAAKNGPYLPAAIFRANARHAQAFGVPEGTIVAAFQNKLCDAVDQWSWLAGHPVKEEDYRFHLKEGRWPDEPEPVAHSETPANGSNEPVDPFERLKGDVADKMEQARAFMARTGGKIAAQVDCDMAANIAKSLTGLKSEADGMHKAEKAPVLAQEREIDGKFRFRDELEKLAKQLKTAAGAFMAAEEKRLRDEAAAKAAAERKRLEDERKELEAQDPVLAAITPIEEAPKVEPIKVQAGGARGAKMGLKTVFVGEINDYRAVLDHYAEHPQVKALIQSLVNGEVRALKGQVNIQGVTVREERKAA